MFRLRFAFILAAASCSPAATQPTQPERANPLTEKRDCDALSRARAEQARITKGPAPRYSGDGSKASCIGYVTNDLKQWVSVTKPKLDAAVESYRRASTECIEPAIRNRARLEGAQLIQWFATQTADAARTATPESLRVDRVLNAAFVSAIEDAIQPSLEVARSLLEECVALSDSDGITSTCKSELGNIPKKRTGKRGSADEGHKALRLCTPPPIAEPSMVAPCSYAGRISARLEFFREKQGGPLLMSTGSYPSELNVSRFELPRTAEGRIRITVTSPLNFDGWANAPDGALELKSNLDIVKDHIRVSQESPLRAYRVGNNLQVTVNFKPRGIVPASWSKVLSCDAVTLQQAHLAAKFPPDEPRRLVSGWVHLYDAPEGKRVGTVDSDGQMSVSVLEKREGWLRVSHNGPFEFDAWIRTPDAPEIQEFGMIGMIGTYGAFASECSHSTSVPLPLLLDPSADAKPVAELPASGQLRLDEQHSSKDFVAIIVPGLGPANPAHRFYVPRQLFEKSVSILP